MLSYLFQFIGRYTSRRRGLVCGIMLACILVAVTGCGHKALRSAQKGEITAADVLAQADRHLEAGQYDEAARFYSWLLESFPHGMESAAAQFGLARVSMLRGELQSASAEFSQFRLNFPQHPLSGMAVLYITECTERIEKAAREKREAEEARLRGKQKEKELVKVPPPPAMPEPMIGAQVLVWESQSWEELDREMADLKAAGFNSVVFRAFSNPGDRFYGFAPPEQVRIGVYFRTVHSPVVADILGRVTQIAHRNGLKLYAWMTSRYADYGLSGEGADRWADRTYDLATGAILKGKGLDLFNDRVVEYLEKLYADLGRYPIDGILFQDDLVSRHTDGYSAAASAAYQRKFGKPLDASDFYQDVYQAEGAPKPRVGRYTEAFWQWVEWKNERLLDVAERLTAAAKKNRQDFKVAINFMYEAASSPRNGLAWLSQSISNAHRRSFDYYAIMAYHRQMEEELGLSLEQTLTLLRRMSRSLYAGAHPQRAIFKLQIRDWTDQGPVSLEEMDAVVKAVREGAEGTGVQPSLVVVPYRGSSDLARIPRSLTAGQSALAVPRESAIKVRTAVIP